MSPSFSQPRIWPPRYKKFYVTPGVMTNSYSMTHFEKRESHSVLPKVIKIFLHTSLSYGVTIWYKISRLDTSKNRSRHLITLLQECFKVNKKTSEPAKLPIKNLISSYISLLSLDEVMHAARVSLGSQYSIFENNQNIS
jgi:hypothetical protein